MVSLSEERGKVITFELRLQKTANENAQLEKENRKIKRTVSELEEQLEEKTNEI